MITVLVVIVFLTGALAQTDCESPDQYSCTPFSETACDVGQNQRLFSWIPSHYRVLVDSISYLALYHPFTGQPPVWTPRDIDGDGWTVSQYYCFIRIPISVPS
jgi:hypothetical protein